MLTINTTGTHAALWACSEYVLFETTTGTELGRVTKPARIMDVAWPYVMCASKTQLWFLSGARRHGPGIVLAEVLRHPMNVLGLVCTGRRQVVVVWRAANDGQFWGMWHLTATPTLVRSGRCRGEPLQASRRYLRLREEGGAVVTVDMDTRRTVAGPCFDLSTALSMCEFQRPANVLDDRSAFDNMHGVSGPTIVRTRPDGYRITWSSAALTVVNPDAEKVLHLSGRCGLSADSRIAVRWDGAACFERHRLPAVSMIGMATLREVRALIVADPIVAGIAKLLMERVGLPEEMMEMVVQWGV